MKARKKIAAVAFIAAAMLPASKVSAAGIPVIDTVAIQQAVMEVYESVQQGINQLEQLKTQYDQYENELRNSLAPAFYVWDQATMYYDKVTGIIDQATYYKNNSGLTIDRYLESFKTPAGYRGSDCFSAKGCDASGRNSLMQQRDNNAEGTKQAVDGQMRVIDQQLKQIQNDSSNLEKLQRSAQSAGGHMEAAQAGNQLLANQANQLLGIRALMVAQQQADATRQQEVSDLEAQKTAAAEALRAGEFKPSNGKNWMLQ